MVAPDLTPPPPAPPVGPEAQVAADTSSAGGLVLEAAANIAVEGGIEALAASGEFVGGAVATGVDAVGSLLGGLFDAF